MQHSATDSSSKYTLPNGFPASQLQSDIIDAALDPSISCIRVDGVAGCAKTTTAEALFMYRSQANTPGGMYLCFNKSIQQEALPKLQPYGVLVSTFHSLGMRALGKAGVPRLKVDTRKKFMVLDALNINSKDEIADSLTQAISYAKNVGIFPASMDDETRELERALLHYGVPCEVDRYAELAELTLKALDVSLRLTRKQGIIDFDDMLWASIILDAPFPKPDFLVVDEAQDTSPIQQDIIQACMHSATKLVFVGDPHQAIYGFRGADSAAMRNLGERFGAVHLPLSITYRVPRRGVELAQNIVPEMQCAPGAKEGTVANLDTDWSVKMFKPGDLLLCRTNRPLLAVARMCLLERVPFQLKDDKLHKSLLKILDKSNCTPTTPIAMAQAAIEAYTKQEVAKLQAKNAPYGWLEDNTSALLYLSDDLSTVQELTDLINQLFTPGHGVKLLTIHRSKGLEAQRVWFLNAHTIPWPYAEKDWELQQESNLYYVGVTRFLDTLNFISVEL